VITHGWLEDSQIKSFEKRGPKRGDTYTVTTGEKFERPAFICMELPGRKSGTLAGTDPLGLKNYRPRPEDEFPPEARGYLANIPVLRQLDAEGLDKADSIVAILLEGTNRALSAEVRKMLGTAPTSGSGSYMSGLAGWN
jgi:hypothetical protein